MNVGGPRARLPFGEVMLGCATPSREDIFMLSIQRLCLQGLLSFPPDMEPFDLQPLNVLIGPNGSGKTNLISAMELLRAAPENLNDAVGAVAGPRQTDATEPRTHDLDPWLWKGETPSSSVRICAEMISDRPAGDRSLSYLLQLGQTSHGFEIEKETIEARDSNLRCTGPVSLYRLDRGQPRLAGIGPDGSRLEKEIELDDEFSPKSESVLSRTSGVGFDEAYPEIAEIGSGFRDMAIYRQWVFGTGSGSREPQPLAGFLGGRLLPDASNLMHVVGELRHGDKERIDAAMKRVLPRYEELTSRILSSGQGQLHLHEGGLSEPIPASHISDGTWRFLALLAALLPSEPPSVLCLEEPELGLHPDAVSALAELLVEASARMQLIVSTHSDALLSALDDHVDSVLVCENDGHGTTVERLDATRLAAWLNDYTLGDIWRIGEIGGNP